MKIKSINLIGSGNVASFLGSSLKSNFDIKAVFSRNEITGRVMSNQISCDFIPHINELPPTDLTIIAVSDDSIKEITHLIPRNTITVHTSGSVGIDVFEGFSDCGVFYPLQTFSNNRKVESKEIPFLIEASNKAIESELLDLCKKSFSEKTMVADSQTRANIHLAAVLVNNFTNYLFTEAEEILQKIGVDISILHPLMIETVNKAIDLGAKNSQTGPAIRNDQNIIQEHANKIEKDDLKKFYLLLSKMIGDRKANS